MHNRPPLMCLCAECSGYKQNNCNCIAHLSSSVSKFYSALGWTGVNERTFVAVKPDGVQRRLVGEIVRRFEKKGFKLVGLKLVQVCLEQLRVSKIF